MDQLIGYMLTLPTYGSWLQGGDKGFVKSGVVCGSNPRLLRANVKNLQKPPVKLTLSQKQVIRVEIYQVAEIIRQEIYSLAVCSNHIHIVANNIDTEISDVVSYYKRRTSYVMKKLGVEGKIWAKGYDDRYCYDQESLQARIDYVERHCEG